MQRVILAFWSTSATHTYTHGTVIINTTMLTFITTSSQRYCSDTRLVSATQQAVKR